jgi:microcin C transport system permease protein
MRLLFKLDPLTEKRWQRFKRIRRAYLALVVIIIVYIVSLFAGLLASNKPLCIYYKNKFYFPVFKFYPARTFTGQLQTEPNYKKLAKQGLFAKHGWALFPPLRYGPNESDLSQTPPAAPSWRHPLGTDDRGRDVLTRLIYGFRISVTFALIIVVLTVIMAIIVGSVQGYFGGWLDITFQRLIEILSTLPFLYIVIILGATLGRSFLVLIAAYALFNWIGLSYYVRAEYLRLRKFQFVEAAKALGQPAPNIIMRHILPNALTPIVTLLPFELITAIFSLSALDYLGFGLPAPTPSWGELMRQGMQNLYSYWLSFFPFLVLFITLLLIAFIGEGVREAVNPKEYAKME